MMTNKSVGTYLSFFWLTIISLGLLTAVCGDVNENKRAANVIKLTGSNWTAVLEGEWMLEFYAPWCPACNVLQPTWEEFSTISTDLGISVGQIDITLYPGLSGRFMVTALPTIFHIIYGEFRQYKGSRSKSGLVEFIEDKKWNSIEPLPSWKSPASVQMSMISYFFELSQLLRSVHAKLLEDYGLPTWGSYLLFAVVTIFIGALIGLFAVFAIDYFSPPRVLTKKSTEHDDPDDSGEDTEDEIAAQDDLIDDQMGHEISESSSQDENVAEEETSLTTKKRKARKAD